MRKCTNLGKKTSFSLNHYMKYIKFEQFPLQHAVFRTIYEEKYIFLIMIFNLKKGLGAKRNSMRSTSAPARMTIAPF